MNASRIFDIAAAIVTVAMVSVVLTSKNGPEFVKAVGSAFADSIKAAKG